MKLGLVGLPMSGKTTIFNALTGADRPISVAAPGKLDVQMGVVSVPDLRVNALAKIFQPERNVEAQITFADVGGLAKGISQGGLSGPFRNQLNQMDALVHVIRVFDDPSVPHPDSSLDPQRDLDTLNAEFLLADLITVEKRIEKLTEEINRGKDRQTNQRELALFERLQAALEEEKQLRMLDLTAAERQAVRGYGFLTLKPKLVVLNTGEAEDAPTVKADGEPVIALAGQLEAEIAQLDDEEAAEFMAEYGIQEPMRNRLLRAAYNLLHTQTFFTVGEDEVRAWPVHIGAAAQEAAGVIHSDLERGFIRAEIVPWDVLVELGGLTEARQAGKLRLEGKGYVMQEGDVMTVRFNV